MSYTTNLRTFNKKFFEEIFFCLNGRTWIGPAQQSSGFDRIRIRIHNIDQLSIRSAGLNSYFSFFYCCPPFFFFLILPSLLSPF
jgi:hypothetical protein